MREHKLPLPRDCGRGIAGTSGSPGGPTNCGRHTRERARFRSFPAHGRCGGGQLHRPRRRKHRDGNLCGNRHQGRETKSGQPERANVRCEPVCRTCSQPILRRALKTFFALLDGQALTRGGETPRQPPAHHHHSRHDLPGCAGPKPQYSAWLPPWSNHTPAHRTALESPQSSAHQPPGQSQWRTVSCWVGGYRRHERPAIAKNGSIATFPIRFIGG